MLPRLLAATSLCALLTACSGGGGGVGSSQQPSTSSQELARSNGVTLVGADKAHARGETGADLSTASAATAAATTNRNVIAVLDSGLTNLSDPAFAGKIVAPWDFVGNDSNVLTHPTDDHGTQVSHIALANGDGHGVVGVAPGAKLMPLRIMQDGWTNDSRATAGMEWARTKGANVVSNSYGSADSILTYDPSAFTGSTGPAAFANEAKLGVAQGLVYVWSANNEGNPDPSWEAGLPQYFPELKGQWLVAVALDTDNQTIADFSSRCGHAAEWCVAAPGAAVGTVDGYGRLASAYGTSMSAPIVSGAVAVLLQAYPHLTPAQVVDILKTTADDLGAVGVDSVYGHGRINLDAATQPVGATVIASGTTVEAGGSSATASALSGSAALGDGVVKAFASAGTLSVFDSYGRSFSVDLASFAAAAGAMSDAAPATAHPFTDLIGPAFTAHFGDSTVTTAFGETALGTVASTRNGPWTLSAGLMSESGSALGMTGEGAFALDHAMTAFTGLGFSAPLSGGLRFSASAHVGQTWGRGDDLIGDVALSANAFAAGVEADALGGALTFGIARPLRASGVLDMSLPTGRDITGNVTYRDASIDLTPTARQTDLHFGWSGPAAGGDLDLGAIIRFSPGHTDAAAESEATVRWRTAF